MFERTIRPTDLAKILGVKQNNKRPKNIADAMAEVFTGFGGLAKYKIYLRKEVEVIKYIIWRMDKDNLTLE